MSIAFWIAEINGDGIAMRDADQFSDVGVVFSASVHLPQHAQIRHPQRDLVDEVERQFFGSTAGQDDLMVFGGFSAEKDQLGVAQVTPVGDVKGQHLLIKAGHALHVTHVNSHVTEAKRSALGQGRAHDRLLHA